jgi:hypothetical protein
MAARIDPRTKSLLAAQVLFGHEMLPLCLLALMPAHRLRAF